MVKPVEQDANARTIRALEDVLQSLNTTNEVLRSLALRMPEDRRALVNTAAHDLAISKLGDARFLPTDGLAAAGKDEIILRDLAEPLGLELPMERLIALRNERYPNNRPRYWGIVNFDLHSAKPRLFVFDAVSRTRSPYLCAHGKGSEGQKDSGFADVFSNKKGSKASSLGVYGCAETYKGHNGYSLRLDGLESTNSNARSREIVVHGAYYVSEEFAEKYKRVGRSEGCPTLDHKYAGTVIDQLKQGSLLIHWKTP